MGLSIGKIRGLQQLSDNDVFKIIAIDHRDVFVNMLKEAHKNFDVESVVEEKLDVIRSTNKGISGYLVDPQYSLPMCIYKQTIPGKLGFMVSLEDNDYDIKNFNENYYFKGLSAEKISEMRASAVKLFFYYNPRSEYCNQQDQVLSELSAECKKVQIPLLLEPVILQMGKEIISPEERVDLVFETLERLSRFCVDLFKIEFPGDLDHFSHSRNLEICSMVTTKLNTPWVIMSSGINIESFTQQLEIACEGGASGYVVGRALWREFVEAKGERDAERAQMEQRLSRLNAITDEKAKKWISFEGLIDPNISQSNWL